MGVLDVSGLTKVFRPGRKGEVTAVDGVSFAVEAGELVGVLGPNGAGKTTTVKCVCTLIRPTSGEITVGGVDAIRHARDAVGSMAAVLEGNRNVYWRLTVRENLEFCAALHGIRTKAVRPYADELIERFGLADKRSTPARQLSRGMQQKLSVACALVRRTPVLLLDEPTLGLDVETAVELRSHLRELAGEGRTILLTSHDMHLVQELCERVIVLNQGRVIADDRVVNLLALFRAQAYRISVAAPLSEPTAAALRARFPGLDVDGTLVRGQLESGYALYELMDVLRGDGALITGIDQEEPDLEEVFLRLVQEAR